MKSKIEDNNQINKPKEGETKIYQSKKENSNSDFTPYEEIKD